MMKKQNLEKKQAEVKSQTKIPAGQFYAEYHGHKIAHLVDLQEEMRTETVDNEEVVPTKFIYLAGDSSLDNKHWFFDGFEVKEAQMFDSSFTAPAVNGYEDILTPSRSVQDVAFHFNSIAAQRLGSKKVVTINASVEESTIADRNGGLLPHDIFIRDHISEDDTLIISLGGNDVALRPSTKTALSVGMLTRLPDAMIQSCLAVGMGHMEWLFHDQLENIVLQMVEKKKPKKIIICMLYYLDEKAGGSWADRVLGLLGYDTNPAKVQLIIRTLFERIQRRGFDIPGVEQVEVFPLFEVLDGKNTEDYCQRVEPSVQGGRKMAEALLNKCI